MKIENPGLKFKTVPSKRGRTNCIVLHHADAAQCTVYQIHTWHINNGWSGIGYHYFVRKDGSVWMGRSDDTVGAHASGGNADSIGICFEGDYDAEQKMPDKQKKAGKELVAYLKGKYSINTVKRHKEVSATSCPGKYFPFDEIASAQPTGVQKVEPEKQPEHKDGTIAQLQDICNRLGYSAQKVDGIAGPITLAGCPLIKKGAKGEVVKWLQCRLAVSEYGCGKDAAGTFGSGTKKAVIAFQKWNKLVQDGIVGAKTWKKLIGLK